MKKWGMHVSVCRSIFLRKRFNVFFFTGKDNLDELINFFSGGIRPATLNRIESCT